MRSHYRYCLPLLAAAYAATAIATAQAPQQPSTPRPTPAPPPPDARERPEVSDAQLGLEVQARLYQQLDVGNLSALVRYGVATLDGTVRTEADRQRAEELALEVHGVESVVNEIVVADPLLLAVADEGDAVTQREGADIETAVTQSLRSDAKIGSRPITVMVDELTNTVTLTGQVASEEEKESAGRLAVSAFPAGQVRNQLEVRQRL
jgi:osmotically-inducible protein OsmY